jgi:hypothetical protein
LIIVDAKRRVSLRTTALAAAIGFGALGAPSRVIASDCSDAVANYNSTTAELGDNLKRYANCVADSRGTDDCSNEFRHLRSSQDDFETAVSSYQSECNQ